MADSNLLIAGASAVGLLWLGRRFLDTPTRLPGWDRLLARAWVPAVVIVGLGVLGVPGADALDSLFWALLLGVGAYVSWQLRAYRPARTLAVALAPFAAYSLLNQLFELVAPATHKRYEDSLDFGTVLTLGWLMTFGFVARSQKKSLAAEQQQRQQAEQEQQRIEAQNRDLSYLVNQRTAALASQTDELRATLSELQATQDQLIQREKMASLGELTAGIAHEIQNPLNFVNNFADVSAELVAELEEERARPTRDRALEADLLIDLKQNLERITQHGGRAAGIVKGMLEHSRASTGERQPTDVNALADEYLRLAYHGLRAKDKTFNADLKLDLAPGLPLVEAVPGDLGRVFLNLVTNAFYAVQKRQRAGEPGYAPTVRVASQLVGDKVQVRVSDNGTGISEAVREKIFQPFFTTKPTGEGTGLGLSLAHDIVVKGHGGTLTVESQSGVGTEFVIALPL